MGRFSELNPNLSIKQHFYSKQNVQQNLRHKNVDFQCKSLQEIFVIVLILYPNLTFLAFRAYLLEPPPQDYIIKRKTIKNLNIKKCDKNYCTYSRIRIGQPPITVFISNKYAHFKIGKPNFPYSHDSRKFS